MIKHIGLCLFNRATYSRCKALIWELAKYQDIRVTVFLSGALLMEEHGNAHEYIRKAHPEASFVDVTSHDPDGSHVGSTRCSGDIVSGLGDAFSREQLSAVIVVADRFETLPAAMAASYLNIPLVHIQGGEITGNIDDKVRWAVSRLADYHFVATGNAKDYLIASGEMATRVFNTGCPSLDLITRNRIKRYHAKERYYLCMFHPETENSDEAEEQTYVVMDALLTYSAKYAHRGFIYYPNPDPGRKGVIKIIDSAVTGNPSLFARASNQEPEQFLDRLAGSRLIVGNSSCGIREASFLGVPAINVGDRQRMRERGWNLIDTGYDKASIVAALESQHDMFRYAKSNLYGSGKSARLIADYLSKLEFDLKGPVTYPKHPRFKENHFGSIRFESHKKGRLKNRSLHS